MSGVATPIAGAAAIEVNGRRDHKAKRLAAVDTAIQVHVRVHLFEQQFHVHVVICPSRQMTALERRSIQCSLRIAAKILQIQVAMKDSQAT